MTSLRPYLIQALIDWIIDNDCTPYAVIDCTMEGAKPFDVYGATLEPAIDAHGAFVQV